MFRYSSPISALAVAGRWAARRRGLWLLTLACCKSLAADEPQLLDAFLGRLGLTELRVTHQERRLAAEHDPGRRGELAKALSERYVEALLAAADEAERFAELRGRVEAFLTAHPAARTSELEIVLLQAEFQRAEAAILAWQDDPSNSTGMAEARATLERTQPLLAGHYESLTATADREADRMDGLKTESERQQAERQVARQRTLAARSDYFAGWAAYYLGVVREDRAASAADYQRGKTHFSRLLDVTDEGNYASVDAESLGLDSVWRSRAVIGLALCELGLERVPAGQQILAWLEQAAVSPQLREQAAYWQLRGLLNAQLWSRAAELAETEVASLTTAAGPGKSSFCAAALRAGARAQPAAAARSLTLAGVTGLARMRQFEMVDKLAAEFQLDEGALAEEFPLTWLRGRRQYFAAEKSNEAVEFAAAARTLAAALDLPAARSQLQDAAQARYYLGWARYRLGEYEAAAQLFSEVATTLRSVNAEVAAVALWMRATCLVERAQKEPRQAAAAIAALAAYRQEFPASPEAARVDLLIARLRPTAAAGEDALADLTRIRAADSSYAAAQFEICRLQHQRWQKAQDNPKQAEPLAKEVLTAVARVQTLGTQLPADYRLKAVLLGVDVLRQQEAVDWSQMEALLDRVAKAAEQVSDAAATRVEFEYRRLEVAQQRNRAAETARHAGWLAEHAGGTPYELPALILLARAADQAVAKATGPERDPQWAKARAVYARLVALLGETPAALAGNKNALAAASKLAHYDELLERWDEAASRLSQLIAAQPADRRFLRRGAMASFQAERYADSLASWRTLLGGLEAGTDEWFEAKYYQILCLQRTDPEGARKTLKQFQLLYPRVHSPQWQSKFQAMEEAAG